MSVMKDPGSDNYFETMLRAELVLPGEAVRPGEPYLEWHQERIYKGSSPRSSDGRSLGVFSGVGRLEEP